MSDAVPLGLKVGASSAAGLRAKVHHGRTVRHHEQQISLRGSRENDFCTTIACLLTCAAAIVAKNEIERGSQWRGARHELVVADQIKDA